MKILMFTSYVPYPPSSGGQIRTYNLVKRLSKKHDFTLVCFYREEKEKNYEEILKKIFKKIYFIKKKKPWTFRSLIKSTASLPLLMNLYDLKEARELIKFLIDNNHWDLIHCEPFYIAHNLPKSLKIPLVLGEHNIEYLTYRRFSDKQFIPLKNILNIDVRKIKKWEQYYWNKAEKIIAVSKSDKKIIEDNGSTNVSLIPNGVDLDYFIYSPKFTNNKKTILFIGDFKWFPNIEAVTYLKEKLWPIILSKTEKTKINLLIVGKFVTEKIKSWNDKNNIKVIENLPDIRSAYKNSDLLLAPLWSGGGTKYKIIEAMASGCPVITTPIGIEGIEASDNKEVFIAKEKDELLKKTIEVLKNDNLVKDITFNARCLIEKKYSWDLISQKLDLIYKSLKK